MFDFATKNSPKKNDAEEWREQFPTLPTCSVSGSFYDYHIGLHTDAPPPQEAKDLADELMQIMAERKIPYQTALYLPDLLYLRLRDSFDAEVFSRVVHPLAEYRYDQRDNRDDQRKD